MADCIFCKIANKEVKKEFIYEDDEVVVFPDIKPVRPIHLLVVVKKHVGELIDLEDQNLFLQLKRVIQKMIKEKGLASKGYRVVINGGGAQVIDHFHIHLMGPIGKGEI